MSCIYTQKYERFGKIRFYEPDHESEMRLLKAPSHTSNGLAVELRKREENQLKEAQALQQGKPPNKKLSRTAGVVGGGGAEKILRRTNHKK